jgi:hypothetical protein
MGSLLFFIVCVMFCLLIEPISKVTGLYNYLMKCSNEMFFIAAGTYVFLWLNATAIAYTLLVKAIV